MEEIRILFVVDGRCRVERDSRELYLGKSDYLLINVLEEVSVHPEQDSLLAVLSLPYFELLRAADRISVRFDCCSLDGKQQKYAEMFTLLQDLLMCFVGDLRAERLKAVGLYYLLVSHLVLNFARAADPAK